MDLVDKIFAGRYADEINKILRDFETRTGRTVDERELTVFKADLFSTLAIGRNYGFVPLTYYILTYCSPGNLVRQRMEESIGLSDPVKRALLVARFREYKDILAGYKLTDGWDKWGCQ